MLPGRLEMKKGLLLITLATMLAALSIAPARAQMLCTVKGKVTDENGPMAGVKEIGRAHV